MASFSQLLLHEYDLLFTFFLSKRMDEYICENILKVSKDPVNKLRWECDCFQKKKTNKQTNKQKSSISIWFCLKQLSRMENGFISGYRYDVWDNGLLAIMRTCSSEFKFQSGSIQFTYGQNSFAKICIHLYSHQTID